MVIEEEYIRLIFGLKLKQLRTEHSLSLFGLAKLSGMSKSYLNEIEKGKKYPKSDKIAILADALEVPYDHLVSLKLDKNLAPIGEILQSKILKEVPFDLFGIKESTLIDIISNAPAKVNAFISTVIKIAQNYNLSRESFFLASLRSYQEAHNNYFEEIEIAVEAFAKAYNISLDDSVRADTLQEILIEEYGYTIKYEGIADYKELASLRNIYIPSTRILLMAKNSSEQQKTFIFAKEIAYNYLEIKDRLYTFPWVKFDSFDQVLHNFMASYFAGALIIPKERITRQLQNLFNKETWEQEHYNTIVDSYNCSPETFYQRLTNILPKQFQFKNLFFIRFTHKENSPVYKLSKELHITQQQAPHANRIQEHYCRRWISLHTLNQLEEKNQPSSFGVQISKYVDASYNYLVLSSATKDPFRQGQNRSVSIGILLSPHLRKKIKFIQSDTIKSTLVGVTCETCAIADCSDRVSPPSRLELKNQFKNIATAVDKLMEEYSR